MSGHAGASSEGGGATSPPSAELRGQRWATYTAGYADGCPSGARDAEGRLRAKALARRAPSAAAWRALRPRVRPVALKEFAIPGPACEERCAKVERRPQLLLGAERLRPPLQATPGGLSTCAMRPAISKVVLYGDGTSQGRAQTDRDPSGRPLVVDHENGTARLGLALSRHDHPVEGRDLLVQVRDHCVLSMLR